MDVHREGELCGSLAQAQATARVDVPTALRNVVVFLLIFLMSSLLIVETQKSQWSAVHRRETG